MKENKIQSESKIQAESVKWFHNNYCLKIHDPRLLMFSIPNEAIQNRDFKFVSTLKAMGLTSGVSDAIVVMPNKILFVEFKTMIGRQSKTQKEFQIRVTDLGFEYLIIRSVEEFKSEILKRM